tara:strand:+ start:5718 stop:5870 length:153 start_codon:yes stop_codon:yes gene_type:complete
MKDMQDGLFGSSMHYNYLFFKYYFGLSAYSMGLFSVFYPATELLQSDNYW